MCDVGVCAYIGVCVMLLCMMLVFVCDVGVCVYVGVCMCVM